MSGSESVTSTRFQEDIASLNDTSSTTMNASSEKLSQHNKKAGEAEHVQLTWRSWVVVLVTCFAQMAQVFVVAGSGQNITFIARDLGDASLAGWIIRKRSILPTYTQNCILTECRGSSSNAGSTESDTGAA